MTFTKEWLQKAISDIETMRDEIPFGLDEDGNNTLSALKLALAGMEAELERGKIRRFELDMSDCDSCGQDCGADMIEDLDGDYVLWEEVLPHLYQHADYDKPQPLTASERAELENYRNAQPDMNYQHLSELYHAQEKRLFKLAQRIKGPAFDKYAHSPSQAIDALESAAFGENGDVSHAAMLQGKSEPVTTAYKLRDAVETIRNSGIAIDGERSMAERDVLNSPVIPDGYVLVPKEITCAMDDAAWEAYHETRCMSDIWAALLAAAAPQQESE